MKNEKKQNKIDSIKENNIYKLFFNKNNNSNENNENIEKNDNLKKQIIELKQENIELNNKLKNANQSNNIKNEEIKRLNSIISNLKTENDNLINTTNIKINQKDEKILYLQEELKEKIKIIEKYETSQLSIKEEIKNLLKYNENYSEIIKIYLDFCLFIKSWIDKQHSIINGLFNENENVDFNIIINNFDNLLISIEKKLEIFEKIEPTYKTPYNVDEHEIIDNKYNDSVGIFIREVKEVGFKLNGKIIKKAEVFVYKKEGNI